MISSKHLQNCCCLFRTDIRQFSVNDLNNNKPVVRNSVARTVASKHDVTDIDFVVCSHIFHSFRLAVFVLDVYASNLKLNLE